MLPSRQYSGDLKERIGENLLEIGPVALEFIVNTHYCRHIQIGGNNNNNRINKLAVHTLRFLDSFKALSKNV